MKYVAIDIETQGLSVYGDLIWMIAVNDGRNCKVYHNCKGMQDKDWKPVRKLLEDPKICKVGHNIAFDSAFIEYKTGICINNIEDTMLNEIVIQGVQLPRGCKVPELLKKHSPALQYTLPRYGFALVDKTTRTNYINRPAGIKFTKEECDTYPKGDVKDLLKLRAAQEYLLRRDNLWEVALLEHETAKRLARMKVVGIGWDPIQWRKIAEENEAEFKRRMQALPKDVSNWNSPAQVKAFFKKRGILINSFDDIDDVLTATKDPILKNFVEARELHKSVTSYGKNWFTDNFCDPDGRIRCDVQQIINTGRMSMANPNLQQLPAKGKHRSAFVPRKGYKFIIGDFSGQEMGIMAAGAGEDLWIDAMLRGDDIHALTASMLYAGQWEQATEKGCTFPKKCSCKGHKALREPTKILNFMLAYGGGPTKFAANTGCTFEEAKQIVKRYKRVVARLTMWLQNNAREALRTGVSFSADPYKRRRVLKGEEDWQIENQGKNNPIQAAGANMLKLAMISLPQEYDIVLVIHDEIILEVKNSDAKQACKVLKKVMEDSATFITGIKGLVKVEPRIADNLTKV